MAPRRYVRTYYRFPLTYPVIFGGAPFVGEGVLTNLSLKGCSVTCNREVLCGSQVRVSMFLHHQPPALPVELGTIKWVRGNQFGVEFVRVPLEAQQRLNRTLRMELIEWLENRHRSSASPASPIQEQ
ncbi:MAG: PilZ domain-containing protein [Nitrospira sp.]|nr:PilZ domain-containing protein [Nitrospira sp.]ULA58461.1 MAG: PilZ domain-containing protein [Nitrospira sp.]